MRAEFHIHTKASHDSMLSRSWLLLACKLRKIKCIAITDHNEVSFALKNKEYFKRHGIEVIVGEEIFTREGEIIGLFLNKRIEPGLSAIETVTRIREEDGLVYIPHPYDEKRYKTVLTEEALKNVAKLADFCEAHNGRNIRREYSVRQDAIAGKYHLIKVVGSDAHSFFEIGRNYCEIEKCDKESLRDELKKAELTKSRCLGIFHFHTKCVRAYRLILKGDFCGLFRAVFRRRKK